MADIRGMRKILSKVTDNADDMANVTSKFLTRAPMVVGGIIIGAGALDFVGDKIGEVSEERRAEKEMKEAKKLARKGSKSKDLAYATVEEFEGYVQGLWEERNKHSRSWGGKIY